MAYETIVYEKRGPEVTLTLNRPDTINAINPQMTAELHGALDEADADAEVRAIVLTGAGRGFSAGFDIARRPDGRSSLDATGVEVAEYIKRWWGRDRDSAMELMHLWHLTKPVRRGARLGDGWRILVCARRRHHDRRRQQRVRPARGPSRLEHDVPVRCPGRVESGPSVLADRRPFRCRRGPAPGHRQRGRAGGRAPGARASPRRADRQGARALRAAQQSGHLLRLARDGPGRRDADEHPVLEHGARLVQRPAGRADRGHAVGGPEGISGGPGRRVPAGALRAKIGPEVLM